MTMFLLWYTGVCHAWHFQRKPIYEPAYPNLPPGVRGAKQVARGAQLRELWSRDRGSAREMVVMGELWSGDGGSVGNHFRIPDSDPTIDLNSMGVSASFFRRCGTTMNYMTCMSTSTTRKFVDF